MAALFIIPIEGHLVIEAEDHLAALMAAQVEVSDKHFSVKLDSASVLYPEQAKALNMLEHLPLDNCGLTVGEFFEDRDS